MTPNPDEPQIRWYVLDDAGEAVPEPDWMKAAAWMATHDRTVAEDTLAVADEQGRRATIRVSTVFLGLDQSHGRDPPRLFETLIQGGPHDGWRDCYASRAEALAGHRYALSIALW